MVLVSSPLPVRCCDFCGDSGGKEDPLVLAPLSLGDSCVEAGMISIAEFRRSPEVDAGRFKRIGVGFCAMERRRAKLELPDPESMRIVEVFFFSCRKAFAGKSSFGEFC